MVLLNNLLSKKKLEKKGNQNRNIKRNSYLKKTKKLNLKKMNRGLLLKLNLNLHFQLNLSN